MARCYVRVIEMSGLPRIVSIVVFTALMVGGLGSCDFKCTCWTNVRNNTPYHLHLLGQYESHLYVPPGGLRGMNFDDYGSDALLTVFIAPGQDESAQTTFPVECGHDGCRFIDIQWEASPRALVYERLECIDEPDVSLDGGG